MTINLLAECKEKYQVDFEPLPTTQAEAEAWRYDDMAGKDGRIWHYSDTHLVVSFFYTWRFRKNASGTVIWIPGPRSPKVRRFQALAGAEGEMVQDCDDETGFKVPNKYLTRALKMIAPDKKMIAHGSCPFPLPVPCERFNDDLDVVRDGDEGDSWEPLDTDLATLPRTTNCLSCTTEKEAKEQWDSYCSDVCRILGLAGLGWRLDPYRIIDLQTGTVISKGPHFDLTPSGIAELQQRAQSLQITPSIDEPSVLTPTVLEKQSAHPAIHANPAKSVLEAPGGWSR